MRFVDEFRSGELAQKLAHELVTLVEPGSCFAGTLAEILLAADRSMYAMKRQRTAATPG